MSNRASSEEKHFCWFVLVLAGVLRFALLTLKPPHFDEGINGWFVDQMYELGFYRYDPANYHGPLHFYLLQLSELFWGRNLFALRFVSSCFSLGAVALVLGTRHRLGPVALWAGFAMAISPAMVFYGRYAIHEAEVLFFLVLFARGYLERQRAWLAWSLTGLMLTKETWFIHVGTSVIASLLLYRTSREREQWRGAVPWAGCTAALLILYTGFLSHPQGLGDFFRGYAFWTQTGSSGAGHEKPFWYWLDLIRRYELFMGVAFVGSVALLFRGSYPLRWLWLNAAGGLLAYSLIPYKTPWCIISFLWPFAFLAGYVLDALVRDRRLAALAPVLLLSVVAHSSYYTMRLNWRAYDDDREPYVYVSSKRNLNEFVHALQEVARVDPEAQTMRIAVLLANPWPVPWMLGQWPRAAFYNGVVPDDLNVDVILVEQSLRSAVEQRLTRPYLVKTLDFRGSHEPCLAYFDRRRFQGTLQGHMKAFKP